MRQCYNNLKELLQKIIGTTLTEVTVVDAEDKDKKFTSKITEDLFSKNPDTFFKAFTHMLDSFSNSLSQENYFTKTMWENNDDQLSENKATEKFCSNLKVSLNQFPISIEQQSSVGNGVCDILITTPNNEVIPIEAKNSTHTELWNAIEKQLIGKYMQTTYNYGIYLVYWFGTANVTSPSRRLCSKPNSHSELQASLVEHYIPEGYKEKIKVFCINCN